MQANKNNNILFISSIQLFPAESGGQLRSTNICNALMNRGHTVNIYSLTGRKKDYLSFNFKKTGQENQADEKVNYNPFYALLQFLSYQLKLPPIWVTVLLSFYIPNELKKLIHSHDIIILDFPFLYPIANLKIETLILNTHNAEFTFQTPNTLFGKILYSLVKNIEVKAFEKISKVLVCSTTDQQTFKEHNIKIKQPFILPNGVDISFFKSDLIRKNFMRKKYNIDHTKTVVLFTGSNFGPNLLAYNFLIDFYDEFEKELAMLNIVFLIAGSVSSTPLIKENLIVTSRVESIHDYFHMSDLAINPITTGSGTNVKMMEYLAAHLPILTTSYGSRGLNLKDKHNCYVFETKNLLKLLNEIITTTSDKDLQNIANQAYKENHMLFDINIAIDKLNLF